MKKLILTALLFLGLVTSSFGYSLYLTEPDAKNYVKVDITLNATGTEASFVVTPLDVYYLVGNGTFDFNIAGVNADMISNPALGPVHNLQTTLLSGSTTPTVSYYNGVTQHNVSSFGVFNTVIDIGAGASDRATSLTFDLNGSWTTAADVLSIKSDEDYLAAAHIWSPTATTANGVTFFVGTGDPNTPVPEPGTIVLLGAGLLGLGIFGRRRLNR